MSDSAKLALPAELQRHLRALVLIAPVLVAVFLLQIDVPFSERLFSGGRDVLIANVSLAVLFPYFGLFMFALGDLFFPAWLSGARGGLRPYETGIVKFFAGAGLLVVFGFGMGLAGLLYWWVTASFFTAVLYAYFVRSSRDPNYFLNWVAVKDTGPAAYAQPDPLARDITALIRAITVTVVLYIFLTRGILINVNASDTIQLYLPYLAETRLQHSIWLDPSHPVYSDFLIGRGNGAHLFLASFTNQFVGQVIGVVYLVSIALVVRCALYLLVPKVPD
ncbi:MAG TPA: hypothetical protein VGC99_23740, partial [Candidatus Tectomicrobia bacterium]